MTQTEGATQTTEEPAATDVDGSADPGMPDDLRRALRPRRENIVPVNQPLTLICQAPRSGGTLLLRLLDGHPQCHAHPHELMIGYPKAHTWPELPLDEKPEVWFAKLKENYLSTLFTKGRRKIPLKAPGEKTKKTKGSYPFLMPPAFQRLLFIAEVERRSPIGSEREILDCYMTSLFNAWLDNQNLRGPEKRWVVAFSPRRAWEEGLGKFFELYPDGRLISILRDPLSWYSSAHGLGESIWRLERSAEAETREALDTWKVSAREMIEAKRRYEERVRIVRFEALLLDTPGTMRSLAEYLEIDFDVALTTPTFNGYQVGANSSYQTNETGVVTHPVKRYKKVLTAEHQDLVRSECEELYQQASALVEGSAATGKH